MGSKKALTKKVIGQGKPVRHFKGARHSDLEVSGLKSGLEIKIEAVIYVEFLILKSTVWGMACVVL